MGELSDSVRRQRSAFSLGGFPPSGWRL